MAKSDESGDSDESGAGKSGDRGKSGDSISIYCLCLLSLAVEPRLNMYTVPGFANSYHLLFSLAASRISRTARILSFVSMD